MSLMKWLFPVKKRSAPDAAAPSGPDGGRKGAPRDPAQVSAQSARRKADRAARRELLYTVVREAMVRSGVLSASYKFKVLSLDGGGSHYLIMVDLTGASGTDTRRLSDIEALIARSAKSRHDLLVTAVYWRVTDAGSISATQGRGESRPAPLESQPGSLVSAPAPLVASSRGPAYEPIHAHEVEAFKKALIAGTSGPAPLTATPRAARTSTRAPDGGAQAGPRSYTLLTGYEDTEMPESDGKSPLLSGTQYGDLR